MKFISWNVNGLRAIVGKGFREVFESLDADFFCVQEIKLKEGQLDLAFDGYKAYYSYADRPATRARRSLPRHEPLSVRTCTGVDKHDHEGRVVALEYPDFYLVNVYVPNSQSELARLDYRMEWEADFLAFIKELDVHKSVIYVWRPQCGARGDRPCQPQDEPPQRRALPTKSAAA